MALDSLDPLTAPMPAPPVRQFSFTDFQTNNPTAPPPGDRLDAEFDRANNAIEGTIAWANVTLNTDGTLRDGIVGESNLQPDLFDNIASDAIAQVQPLVNQATAYSASAGSSSVSASSSATSAASQAVIAQGAAGRANNAQVAAEAARDASQGYADDASAAATGAANADNDAQGAAALAQDYADVTQAWAEHMPDPIPPNILAVMGITGDHWSSRWWANQAANAFGALTSLYLGAYPTPPAQTPTGQPIPIGAIYFNTTSNQPYVWTGSGWMPFYAPTKALTLSLAYSANGSQTTFPLTTVDLAGNSYHMNATTPEPLDVFVNGVRLLLNQPVGVGDWTVNPATSTVTLVAAPRAGSIIQVDVLTPTSQLAPSQVQTRALVPFSPIDGVTVTYPLRLALDNSSVSPLSAVELFVSIDGAVQQPGTDYNVIGSNVTFGEAPLVGARVWAYWYGPGSSGGSGSETNAPVIATGGTTSRSLEDHTGSLLVVEDFGAKGDGVTDDSAAFNAYAAYIRAATGYQAQRTLMLSVNRTYLVRSTLNFNSFGVNRVTIIGNGSNIVGNVGATKAIISAMASAIAFKDLRITAQGNCLYGVQIGIVDATGLGDLPCHMDCAHIIGTFVNASLYNRGAECSSFVDCRFQTNTAGSYALIMDGCVHWPIDQSTITDTLYTGSNANISFNGQTFINAQFTNHQSGSAVWMGGGLNRHNYVASYANVTDASPVVVYYAPNATMALSGLTWDVHSEVLPSCWFFITGPYATPVIENLVCQDHFNQIAANGFVFVLDATITTCTLRNLEYRAPLHYQTNVRLFDQPAKYTVTGRVEVPTAAAFNSPASFNGLLLSGSPQTVALTANGNTTFSGATTAINGGFATLGVGSGTTCALYMATAAGSLRTINWFSGTTGGAGQRWNAGVNGTAEGGANAGSDFLINAYSDTGVLLNSPLTIIRSSGQVGVAALRVVGNAGFNNAVPIGKPTVSGSRGGNAALASLLTGLAAYGLVTDTTTA